MHSLNCKTVGELETVLRAFPRDAGLTMMSGGREVDVQEISVTYDLPSRPPVARIAAA